jgi:hypothetical protein
MTRDQWFVRLTRLAVFGLLVSMLLGTNSGWSQSADYNSLVAGAKSDLAAGKLDQALSEATRAISIDQLRWEGYMIAAGASIKQHRCDAARDFLSKAIAHAPVEKKDGLMKMQTMCSENEPAKERPAETLTVIGLVAFVEGDQIILDIGTKDSVKVGDQFNISRVTREIKDPASGKVIRTMISSVGVVKVTDVDMQSAGCTAVSGSVFKVGDMVSH